MFIHYAQCYHTRPIYTTLLRALSLCLVLHNRVSIECFLLLKCRTRCCTFSSGKPRERSCSLKCLSLMEMGNMVLGGRCTPCSLNTASRRRLAASLTANSSGPSNGFGTTFFRRF